jgi:hypothetical protein
MKKEWKNYDTFRPLEPTSSEAQRDLEKKLDADREWSGDKGNRDPLEHAIPLEEESEWREKTR